MVVQRKFSLCAMDMQHMYYNSCITSVLTREGVFDKVSDYCVVEGKVRLLIDDLGKCN